MTSISLSTVLVHPKNRILFSMYSMRFTPQIQSMQTFQKMHATICSEFATVVPRATLPEQINVLKK